MIDFISNAKITGGQNQSRVYKWPAAGATQATLARICPPGSKRHLRDENNNNIQLRNEAKWFKNGEYFNSDAFIEYALTDFGYRNTAKVIYEMYFNNYIPHLKDYRTKSLEIIVLIDEKLVVDE